jgi:Lon-like ATP-dependent protease
MTEEIWREVSPQFSEFAEVLNTFDAIESSSFLATQPRVEAAIERFTQINGFARFMFINSPDNSIYRQLVSDSFAQFDNVTAVTSSETFDHRDVFSSIKVEPDGTEHVISGLLESANGGYLILSANWILANPGYWPQLKAVVLGEKATLKSCDPRSPTRQRVEKAYDVKLVIVGDRNQLADIDYIDGDIRSGICLFCELEMELKLDSESIIDYLSFLKWLSQAYKLPPLSTEALKEIMTAGTRYTEDQFYLPLCLLWHRALLEECCIESEMATIEQIHVQSTLDNRYYRESYLPERALSDILNGQVIIETEGKQIGQVNGLTVIEVAGHPICYGEPARISCVIHFGDGDINDVERKADLGGNLHAKGMMIMQAFVSSALDLKAPLPYSASIVFEQSYSEVDGDSASLAEVCSFLSALSDIGLDQQIAVTGAVDQFGRVQAVGGLNEKIEGFYQVCAHQGFTGNQGVILPHTNLRNLALHHTVVESIKNGEFHIWPVATVDEAVPLIMGQPFRSDDEENVLSKIAQRIDEFEQQDHEAGLLQRLRNWIWRN